MTTPLGLPFYPELPAIYRGVKFQLVQFTADPAGVAPLLPELLEPSPDGECFAAGLAIPYSSSYGSFEETFLLLKCRFRGQTGYYCSHVFHNGPAGIAAGREIYGTPKIYAKIEITQTASHMRTFATIPGRDAWMSIETDCAEPVAPAELPGLAPSWRLKLIPRADRPGPAIMQLIDGSGAARNQVVHVARRGSGAVSFGPALAALRPVSTGAAFYLETSYEEHFAEIVHDYLDRGSA
ncbi:MAG: acetoacetate decarboxylase family protein [Bryobacteraceae bacterium]